MAIAEMSHGRVSNPIDLVEEIATRNDWAMRAHQRRRADPDGRGAVDRLSRLAQLARRSGDPAHRLRLRRQGARQPAARGLPAGGADQRAALARPLRRVDPGRPDHVPPGPDAERRAGDPAPVRGPAQGRASRPASATTRPSSSSSGPARRAARRWPPPCSRPKGGLSRGPDQASRSAQPRSSTAISDALQVVPPDQWRDVAGGLPYGARDQP